jgi:hypothetical protein
MKKPTIGYKTCTTGSENCRSHTPVVPNSGKSMIRVAKKPEMTVEEKTELAAIFWNLQLRPKGMNQIMAIVKKGVG